MTPPSTILTHNRERSSALAWGSLGLLAVSQLGLLIWLLAAKSPYGSEMAATPPRDVPPLPGLDDGGCLTSDTLWSLRELPQRLLVLGGGPIGCELAQAFARLSSQVTQVEMAPRLMLRAQHRRRRRLQQRINHPACP